MAGDERGRGLLAGLVTFGGAVISAVAGFAFTLVVARGWGDVGAGVILQVVAAMAIATSLAKLGLDSVLLWRLPRLADRDPGGIGPTVLFACLLAAVASMIAAVGLYLLAPMIAPDYAPELRAIVLWALPCSALLLILLAGLRALGDVTAYVGLGNVAVPVARPLVVIALAAMGLGTTAATVGWAVAVPFAVVVAGILLLRRVRRVAVGPTRRLGSDARLVTKFALPRTLSQGLEQGLLWVDLLIVGALEGAAQAGIYGGATRFIAAGLLVDAALRVLVSPTFSTLLGRGDVGAAQRLYRSATAWLVLGSTPVYVTLAMFAPAVLALLGPEFIAGGPALVLLAVGSVLTFTLGPVHSLLLMAGHSGWAAFNKAVALGLNIGANLLLLPRYGLIGAAAAWVLSMVVDAVLAYLQVRRLTGVSQAWRSAVLAAALAVAATLTPALVARSMLGAESFLAALLTGLLGAGLTAAAAYRFRSRLGLQDLNEAVKARSRGGGSG